MYFLPDGPRMNLGIKYYRITGRARPRARSPTSRAWAGKAASHAGNFMFNRESRSRTSRASTGRADRRGPYDAELYGHWWFEGPDFLDFLLRKMPYDQDLSSPSRPASTSRASQPRSQPPLSSWGDKGYAEVWLNGTNDWIYRHLHVAGERMVDLALRSPPPPNGLSAPGPEPGRA